MKLQFLVIIAGIFISFQHQSFAQNNGIGKIDSLLSILKTAKPDTSKVTILMSIANEFLNNNFDTALYFASEAKMLAVKINYKMGIANGCVMIGKALTNLGKYEKALKNSHDALKIYDQVFTSAKSGEKSKILKNKASVYNLIGIIYYNQGIYPEAIRMYFISLKTKEEIGDKEGMASSYINIGIVYLNLDNDPEALKNFFLALKICEGTGNKISMANTYNNIAIIYSKQGNYQQALKMFVNSLKIREAIGDKGGVATSNQNIGTIYYDLGDYPEALKNYQTALTISKKIGNKRGIASSCNVLGRVYAKQKKNNEALQYLNKGLTHGQEIGSLESINESYFYLAEVDSAYGDFKQALEHYKMYIITRDSMFNQQNTKKLVQSQMQYDFDKKESLAKVEQEKKDELALKELQTQKLMRNGFIAGFAVVLLFAGVFFRQRNKIKKGNAALQVAKDRAEQSEQFKQQFLANMSHEIRTPMNAVMGMTSLVLDTPLQEKQKFYLEGIKKSSDTLLHIINDILDLSKIEAGKMELEKIDFSLKDTLRQVKQTLNHRAEEKGLELLTDIDPEIDDVVIGDPMRLTQVLINLAGNAIKFTEKGSISIEIKKGDSESSITFSIIDTGIGISKDKLQTVFEKFSQANASDTRKYGGTGLGLSISRQLVELMGGEIYITSVEGSGTTFSFSANFENGSAEKLEQRLASQEQVDGTILDDLSILVVDDNEYNRIVAKDTLVSKSKALVIAVGSAQEAIDLLRKKKFDVVLMDVQMPVMNGFEATMKIRNPNLSEAEFTEGKSEIANHNIPIIALTASVLRTDLDKCKAAGMDSYIPKPFKASQLIIGIAQVLNIALRVEKRTESGNVQKAILSSGVTDLEYLSKFCEGDQARMKKYIEMFLSSVSPLLEKIKVAIEINDHLEIANQLHGFKTKLLMMGMKEAKELASEIEMLCRQGTLTEIITLKLHKLIQAVETATIELASF